MTDPGADASVGWANAALFFPTLRLRFAGGAALALPPTRYLFSTSSGNWCLAFFDNGGRAGFWKARQGLTKPWKGKA